MQPVMGFPVVRGSRVDGRVVPQIPRIENHVQRFRRSVSRGPQRTRIFTFTREGERSPAFEVVGDFPARAFARDNSGTAICSARFHAGLGYRSVELMWDSQKLAKAYGGLFWGTTGTFMGKKFKLEGSTTYGNWIVQTDDGQRPISLNGDGAIQVEAGVDPVLAVLLTICCEELAGKNFRFFIW